MGENNFQVLRRKIVIEIQGKFYFVFNVLIHFAWCQCSKCNCNLMRRYLKCKSTIKIGTLKWRLFRINCKYMEHGLGHIFIRIKSIKSPCLPTKKGTKFVFSANFYYIDDGDAQGKLICSTGRKNRWKRDTISFCLAVFMVSHKIGIKERVHKHIAQSRLLYTHTIHNIPK